MIRISFQEKEIAVLIRAIDVSEELISDFYKITTSEWRRHRYDIQSLQDLREEEITDLAFAQIRRYARSPHQRVLGSEPGDFFKICLQDHVILRALERDPRMQLLPLATYIVIHELIHVIRFSKFLQLFDSTSSERDAEERLVHSLTYTVLGKCRINGMDEVLAAFKDCRTMETFVGTH
jgi:hypothetical protein